MIVGTHPFVKKPTLVSLEERGQMVKENLALGVKNLFDSHAFRELL